MRFLPLPSLPPQKQDPFRRFRLSQGGYFFSPQFRFKEDEIMKYEAEKTSAVHMLLVQSAWTVAAVLPLHCSPPSPPLQAQHCFATRAMGHCTTWSELPSSHLTQVPLLDQAVSSRPAKIIQRYIVNIRGQRWWVSNVSLDQPLGN